mgnify:CR=1 FL=1
MTDIIKVKNKLKNFLFHEKTKNCNVYFIVSTGRTGTNFMESFLNAASDDVFCVHEPQPDLFKVSLKKIREKKSSAFISEQIKKVRYPILKESLNQDKRKYVESNPFATFLIPELKQTFKHVKFVFIYRDLNTYLLSALNKSPLGNGINNFYAASDGRKRPCPADFENDKYAHEWSRLSRAQKITWYWNKCNTYLRTFARENSAHVLELKFEDLFSKDNETKKAALMKLFSLISIEISNVKLNELLVTTSEKRNQTQENFHSSLNELSDVELEWINTISKDLKNELGYT